MIENVTLVAFSLLFFKHFVADFLLQGPYQFLNKGNYGHPGGILHAVIQAVGTLLVLVPYLGYSAVLLYLAIAECVIHYHIDWAKMSLNVKMDWKCDKSKEFWWLVGFDQYLHYMTYAAMLLIYFG
ncbi:MAG TPA: DUF3307 domain-containing protein [Patescibacteria group bacterium]|nr:DUF3307 domain-containing protein [Patescibacteria group bacterium]